MDFRGRFIPMVAGVLAFPAALWSLQPGDREREALDPAGVQRLVASTGGSARVAIHPATGAARFIRLDPGAEGTLAPKRAKAPASFEEESEAFFFEYGTIFGIQDPRTELALEKVFSDGQGRTSLTYRQYHRGVPVFAGELKTHFNARKQLSAVNGTFVPAGSLDTSPSRSWQEASRAALGMVEKSLGASERLNVRGTALLVYRAGLVRGIPGQNHLVWEVEVGNGADVREFVYVDAHSGKVVDQITGIHDDLYRRAYDGQHLPNVPPSYPDSPFWEEGDPFPTGNAEADNMILASGETYNLFFEAFGRDSFDGAGGIMDSIFNRGYNCPNASWNGTFISFCPGLTTDDVTGHEWTHAYTQYTHGLIYAWQSGALNESYSDIYGEVVDRINGRDAVDRPVGPRTADACSIYGGTPPPTLVVTGGPAAGSYESRASVNEPPRPFTIGPTPMALAIPPSACTPVTGVSGQIAIIDWTLNPDGTNECGSVVRATNAFNAGAAGIIFVAPASGILNLGSIPQIASVQVTNADGQTIKAGLPASATISLGVGTDDSERWLIGEDDTAVGLSGPLRDMWNPRCFGNPGKVSDTFEYVCSTADQGGVHTNSGIPNHAFALIVDGGTYNGQTISGIGLTKAAHIYFRAMDVYQHPSTDFPDHADSIEQSCTDLIGVNLAGLLTGDPSGEIISSADCGSVEKAVLAVELRTPPVQCNFQPILDPNPPARCPSSCTEVPVFSDDFETGSEGWEVSHVAVTPADFTDRDWVLTSTLPGDRPGTAFFAPNPNIGTCGPGGDESGVLYLESPAIVVPAFAPKPLLTFDHYVATEAGWDGGNLKISVNGGAYTLVAPEDFTFNPYNTVLVPPGAGNTNPLAGEPAFSGTDGGSVGGSWGRSHVNLDPYASPGDSIRLRWDFGNDGCTGVDGWYVDDVKIFACVPKANPTIRIDDVSVTEGNKGKKSAKFTISLSHASTKPVTVRVKTQNGTAKKNEDFSTIDDKTLTIKPLAVSASITVQITGEKTAEPDETFTMNLSKPQNAGLADANGICTILNDD